MAIIGNPLTAGGAGGVNKSIATAVANAFVINAAVSNVTLDVTRMWDGIFSGNENLYGATLTELEEVPESAFEGCVCLSEAYVNEATTIGDFAFSGCTSLATVNANSAATFDVGKGAFYGCTAMTDLTYADYAASIGAYAFAMATCSTDTGTVDMTWDHTTYVGDHAFENNPLPYQMTFNAIEHIGSYAFAGTPITSMFVNAGSVSLSEAFAGCTYLAGASIVASTVTDITRAFYGCSALTEVGLYCTAVPSGIDTAFADCSALTTVYVNSDLLADYITAVPSMSTVFSA